MCVRSLASAASAPSVTCGGGGGLVALHVTGSRLEQLWQMLFLQKPDVGTGLAGRLRSPPSDRRSRGPALLPAVPRRSGPASATSRSSRRWGQEPRGRCAEPAFLVERFRKPPPPTHTLIMTLSADCPVDKNRVTGSPCRRGREVGVCAWARTTRPGTF